MLPLSDRMADERAKRMAPRGTASPLPDLPPPLAAPSSLRAVLTTATRVVREEVWREAIQRLASGHPFAAPIGNGVAVFRSRSPA